MFYKISFKNKHQTLIIYVSKSNTDLFTIISSCYFDIYMVGIIVALFMITQNKNKEFTHDH